MRQRAPLLVLLAIAVACVSGSDATAPRTHHWMQYATPADGGYDATGLERARSLATDAGSAAVMAISDGRVVAAWGDVERKLELHSVRKSIYAALWGIAEERGLVRLDATLASLGVDDLQPLAAEEKRATVADLLRARSGVYHPAAYAASDDEAARPARGAHAPGTHWYYNNWDFNVAGALLEQIAGKPLGVLFDEWIARPIGMEDYTATDVFAVLEPRTSRWPALTFRMSTRDLARFGQLWLDRGRWNGTQIVPEAWIDRASTAASETGPGQGYAMMWWTYDGGALNAERYPAASRHSILLARGTGGQTIFIVPDAKLVVVHRGDTDHGKPVGGREVWTMFDRILGAKSGMPAERPRLIALRAEPFPGQPPPFEWPAPVALEPAALEHLTGDYEIAPGVTATIYLHDGRLFASMPREGEAELFARSASEHYLRVDPSVTLRFDLEPSGRARAVRVNLRGREIVAVRR